MARAIINKCFGSGGGTVVAYDLTFTTYSQDQTIDITSLPNYESITIDNISCEITGWQKFGSSGTFSGADSINTVNVKSISNGIITVNNGDVAVKNRGGTLTVHTYPNAIKVYIMCGDYLVEPKVFQTQGQSGGGASSSTLDIDVGESKMASMTGVVNSSYTSNVVFTGSNDQTTYEDIPITISNDNGDLHTRATICTTKYRYYRAKFSQTSGAGAKSTLTVTTF